MKNNNAVIAEIGLESLIDRANALKLAMTLKALWSNEQKYSDHLVKRIKLGEITDEADYQAKTFQVLAGANSIIMAIPENEYLTSGKLQLETGGWVVLLGNEGKIITSYPFDPNKTTFETRHLSYGDTIYEHIISDGVREILKRIFGKS